MCRLAQAHFLYLRLRNGRLQGLIARARGTWSPPLGTVQFSQLASTTPVSLDFGWDRGTPVDRYYIEQFLQARAADIRGRVLEIGDDAYSARFGGPRITKQDILHLNAGSAKATIVGDLSKPGVLPENTFDCILLTQTLQLIFDLPQAANRLYSALRPGGILSSNSAGHQRNRPPNRRQGCLYRGLPSPMQYKYSRQVGGARVAFAQRNL